MAQDRENELFGNKVRAKTTYRIVESIRKSYVDKKTFLSTGNNDEIEQILKNRLSKYFEYVPDKDSKVASYKW
jgi:signal recognition particle GTPase